MKTNNPPNANDFAKKSPVKNKRRLPKRKPVKKASGSGPISKEDIAALKFIHACFFLLIAATSLKDMLDRPNAE